MNFVFVLNDNEIPVKLSQKINNKFGVKISDEFLSSGKYFVQSAVSLENFKKFIDFLYEKIDYPIINNDNYYEYLLLRNEFNNIISCYLAKPEFEEIRINSILKNAISKEIIDKSLCEEYIAQHLDYYLEIYGNEVSNIPFTTLYNIFVHKKRVLNNHERANKFITKIFNDGCNKNDGNKKLICALYETLDGDKLDKESFNELLSKKGEHFGFIPLFNTSFVSNFNNSISQLKNEMESQYAKKFNDFMQQQLKLMNELKYFNQQNFDLVYNKIDETKNEIKKLSQSIKNVEIEINQISKNNGDIQKMLAVNEDIQIKIKTLSEKVIDIKSSNDQISKKFDDVLPTKFNDIESQTKQILEKVLNLSNLSSFKNGGILHDLSDKCGGNVHIKGIVNVTSSSIYDSSRIPENAVDFNGIKKDFRSSYEKNAWLKYDFKNIKVRPVGYSIKSTNETKGFWHPVNWVIEGSNTDSADDWTILDVRNEIKSLDDSYAFQTFVIQNPCDFYQYLRIRQTGKDSHNDYYLEIAELDFYGITK